MLPHLDNDLLKLSDGKIFDFILIFHIKCLNCYCRRNPEGCHTYSTIKRYKRSQYDNPRETWHMRCPDSCLQSGVPSFWNETLYRYDVCDGRPPLNRIFHQWIRSPINTMDEYTLPVDYSIGMMRLPFSLNWIIAMNLYLRWLAWHQIFSNSFTPTSLGE